MASGTTLVEALHLGRQALGVELDERWAAVARDNIALARRQGAGGSATVVCGDGLGVACHLGPKAKDLVDLVVTSPPYGPSLHGSVRTSDGHGIKKHGHTYPKDDRHLGNAGYRRLLGLLGELLTQIHVVVRPGGFVVLVVRPWREAGKLVDFPGDLGRLGTATGFDLWERNVALLCGLRDDGLVPRASFFQLNHVRKQREHGMPLSVISHEDVLVFRKSGQSVGSGNPKELQQ